MLRVDVPATRHPSMRRMSRISARGQYSSSDVRLVINKGTDSISKYISRTVGERFLTFTERIFLIVFLLQINK